jgi:hypothetical protein
VIDLREESENAFDSMCVNSESISNETDESDLHTEKHSEHRTCTWRGIVIELIGVPRNTRLPIRLTRNITTSEGTKTEWGTTMSRPDSGVNPVTVTDPPETQTQTLAQAQARML